MEITDGYDFVIVGGGTAGCVIAARLTEDSSARVLLLEAGDGRPTEADPAAWPSLQGTSADWAGTSVVQTATGTSIPWPRGRGLGGSSAINGMAFIRGHHSSYDAWVGAGATGWGFDDLLPYMCRSEHAGRRNPVIRGVSGPLRVRPAARRHPVAEAGLAAAAELGYPTAVDINSGLEEGFGWADCNIVNGRRQSSADAYLTPVLQRPGLEVVTGALVHRVCVEGDRCTGVEYSVGGDVVTVGCRGEVVLTAGTVGSAQLLMLSGIGPQSHLRDVGVEVVLDLPGVGANVQDHPRSTVVYSSAQPVPSTRGNHGEVVGLIRSKPDLDGPDLQIQIVDVPHYAPGMQPALPAGHGYSIAFSAMAPRSRGSVRLSDARPGTAPRLDPNYFSDPSDLQVMTIGLRIARAIGQAGAMDPWRGEEVLPGREVYDDDSVRSFVCRNLRTYSHQVGTCRIGMDDLAVVDTDLRVHGISRLRVADASVMPSLVSANTNATVYGIAERAAAIIGGTAT
jgi:choline dehydrogenase